MEDRRKNISPHVKQVILRTLGLSFSTYLGNDLYFLLKAVNIIINDVGEDFVREELKSEGRDWDKIKSQLTSIEKKVLKAKPYYDMLEDKTFHKKEFEQRNRAEFLRHASKIPLVDNPLIWLYAFLVRKTDLRVMTIPSEAFKVLEHSGFRKLNVAGTTSAGASISSWSSTETKEKENAS